MTVAGSADERVAGTDGVLTRGTVGDASHDDRTFVNEKHDLTASDDHEKAVDAALAPTTQDDAEGGILGIRAVFGCWCIYFCCWGFIGSWAIFQTYYVQVRLSDYTQSQVAWIGALQLCIVYLSSVFTGRLYDSGWMSTLLAISCITTTLGFMMASISTKYWHYLLSQGLVVGLGFGAGFTPAVSCASSYYKKKRGLANGALSSGSAISGIIIPIYLSKMINNPNIGLDWALRTSGFICFILHGTAFLIMRQKQLPPNNRPLLDFNVFKAPAYSTTVLAYMCTALGIFYPVFYIQSIARSKGVDQDTAFWSVAIFNGVSLIGRVIPPILSDIVGPHNALLASIASACILAWSFPAIQNWAGVAVYAGFYGLIYGSYVTLTPVVSANLSDTPQRIGTHIGMAFVVNAVGALAGQPALGAVVAATGQFWQAALIAAGFLTIATGMGFVGNILFRRRMKRWRV